MSRTRPHLVVALGVLVLLAGCAGLFGDGDEPADPAVTPAPIPEDAGRTTPPADSATTPAATPADPNGRSLAGTAPRRNYWAGIAAGDNGTTVSQPRILSARPICDRPPGQVIHIQVTALDNNDPTTDEGINTTWQFLAPTYRQSFGTYTTFADAIIVSYRPLLTARAVAYGPLDRDGSVATQRVSVLGPDGTTTSYTWRVENQTTAPYEGCWMTTGITPVTSQ